MTATLGNVSQAEIQSNIKVLTKSMLRILSEEDALSIQGFGTFEVKKRMERVVVNPATRQKMLVPPKMILNFKPSSLLKGKIKKA